MDVPFQRVLGGGWLGIWTLIVGDTVNDKTGTWNSYNLTFLMGDIVMKDALPSTQEHDIKARSLTLSNPIQLTLSRPALNFQARDGIDVTGGSLVVNGSITEDSSGFGSKVNITGGTLSGAGSITATQGVLNSAGTVSPGNSIDTLTITGDYTQGSQGRLLNGSRLSRQQRPACITGSASLDGTLETVWTGGYIPAPNTMFGTILTATAGVTGQFSTLLTNITPTVVFTPKYDVANQVYLVVERDYANKRLALFLTPNQRAVGSMLNSVGNTASGDLNTVLTALDALTTYGQATGAMDQLARKGCEAQYGMGINSGSFQTANIADRLSDLRGAAGSDFVKSGTDTPVMLASASSDLRHMLPPEMPERWGLFVKGNAVYGDQKDTPDRTGYDLRIRG
jgi:hypothetical protein